MIGGEAPAVRADSAAATAQEAVACETLRTLGASRTGRTLLASGGDDGLVRLWDPVTRDAVGEPLTGHRDDVFHLCRFDVPDGRTLLVSADDQGGVRLWDPDTSTTVGRIDLPGPVCGLDTLPDGRLVIASDDWVCTARIRHR